MTYKETGLRPVLIPHSTATLTRAVEPAATVPHSRRQRGGRCIPGFAASHARRPAATVRLFRVANIFWLAKKSRDPKHVRHPGRPVAPDPHARVSPSTETHQPPRLRADRWETP